MLERLDTVVDIIQHEARKYKSTIDKGKRLVKVLAEEYKGRVIPLDELIRLYDTHGVPPEIVASVSKQEGASVDLPDDFYALVCSNARSVSHSRGGSRRAPSGTPFNIQNVLR